MTGCFEVLSHEPESIDTWLKELHIKTKGNIAVAVELTKGSIVYALQKYSFVTVFPIHGLTLARYRQAMFPSGAKDDPMDAELALDMMLNYPNKIQPLRPSTIRDCAFVGETGKDLRNFDFRFPLR